MRIRCDDGIVREFSRAICDGDRLPDGTRANLPVKGIDSECTKCGYVFGVHSSQYLKPRFKQHVCKAATVTQLACNRCGRTWYPSSPKPPGTCPNKDCRSPYWNKKRVRKVK